MTGLVLWLRSLAFNVGWYAASAIIAIAGTPILLMPRRAVVAWARLPATRPAGCGYWRARRGASRTCRLGR